MLIYTPKVPAIVPYVANGTKLIEHWGFDLIDQTHPLSSLKSLNLTLASCCCPMQQPHFCVFRLKSVALHQQASGRVKSIFTQGNKNRSHGELFTSHCSRLQSRCSRLVIRNSHGVMLSKRNILSCKCSHNVQQDTCSCSKAGYDTKVPAKSSSVPLAVTSQFYWLAWFSL